MILEANDLIEWIADRETLLITAWTPELVAALGWVEPFAEPFAGELHTAMTTTLMRRGTEVNFLKLIEQSETGIEPETGKALAERFFGATLKLARASARLRRYRRTVTALPYLRSVIVDATRTNPGHLALEGIILPQAHRFWSRWCPPLDIECRCSVTQVSGSQLRRQGWTVTSEEDSLSER